MNVFPENEVHFMIDVETLALTPDAMILSLGACQVTNDEEVFESNSFYQEVSLDSQIGRKIDPSTMRFWFGNLPAPVNGVASLTEVLSNFTKYLDSVSTPDKIRVMWCKGTDFDYPILSNAFKSLLIKTPWVYNAVRDFRTLKKLFPEIAEPKMQGVVHNAMDDARHQAKHLIMIMEYINNLKSPEAKS